jgi:hypothetical protein
MQISTVNGLEGRAAVMTGDFGSEIHREDFTAIDILSICTAARSNRA